MLPIAARAQAPSGGALSASAAVVPVNTSTSVIFRLALPVNPKLITSSPNLQRLGANGSWSVIGPLFDNGTNGDTTPGDGIYSRQVALNEGQLGSITFRGTSAYQGTLLRAISNQLTLNVTPALSLAVESGSSDITIIQGAFQNVVTTFNLTNNGFGSVAVQNVVTIVPSTGLTFTSDYPASGWSASASSSFVLNQSFSGAAVGEYLVTNTGTIVGRGITASDSIIVRVVPSGGNPQILPVGAVPGAIQIGVPTRVVFTASITDFVLPPAQVELVRIDGAASTVVATMLDDGSGDDLQAADGIFTGAANVTAATEGVVQYRARATFPGVAGVRTSPLFPLNATPLPTEPAPSDMTKIVFDPVTGGNVIANEALVTFNGTPTAGQIVAFAGQYNATVVGSIPALGVYQLRTTTATAEQLNALLTAMRADSRVAGAEPNGVGGLTEFTPNDPNYATQYAPQKIRADEAWVIARGSSVIAVLDTGVDYNHEDLSGRVINGRDFVNADDDSMDDQGHGTHVAGIAAAAGNNGKGVAGIALGSRVLAIKVINSAGSCTWTHVAGGIVRAADNGAKVLNLSLSFPATSTTGSTAVNYAVAKGAVVVVAAGNNGSSVPRFPAGFANAFTVGSTTSSDGRSSFSNFGAHVDIAAPGSAILSTLMGGGYGNLNGTSMAAPCVAGAAAVLWSRFPSYSAAQIQSRLQTTAVELPGLDIGGRVDLFEAVFNGSFEDDTRGWTTTGTSGSVPSLGPLAPRDRKKFGFASSGPAGTLSQTTLEQSFTIQPGVTQFVIGFDYNFVTEEYPEWVNRGFNDNMRITLVGPGGVTTQLAFEDVDNSAFTAVGGIDLPGGDSTVGQTGWKSVTTTVPVSAGAGNYRIIVRDEGDGIYDSNVLIDKVRFK